ncbi:MAG: hypothetical protein ACE5E6_01790 [Phycisphaerae bacterium]
MTNVDQFESMFRAAAREPFVYDPVDIGSVLVVTDRDRDGAAAFGARVRSFLSVLDADRGVAWRDMTGSEFRTAGELLERVEAADPALICTYRNLHSTAWRWPYSLGTHVDLLTQHTRVPIMLLPHPEAQHAADHALQDTNTVMAITDDLTGDHRLVNHAVRFVESGGVLWLTHIEDEMVFARYVDVIGKLPAIDTDTARAALKAQLLREPDDYIAGCRDVLAARGVPLTVEKLVGFGRRLAAYTKLIEQHRVDLLVLNTKDEDQLAMHGVAYALAVELRHIPLLML